MTTFPAIPVETLVLAARLAQEFTNAKSVVTARLDPDGLRFTLRNRQTREMANVIVSWLELTHARSAHALIMVTLERCFGMLNLTPPARQS